SLSPCDENPPQTQRHRKTLNVLVTVEILIPYRFDAKNHPSSLCPRVRSEPSALQMMARHRPKRQYVLKSARLNLGQRLTVTMQQSTVASAIPEPLSQKPAK